MQSAESEGLSKKGTAREGSLGGSFLYVCAF